jgi:imidazole glycerol-phosphate synthase subunit HisH
MIGIINYSTNNINCIIKIIKRLNKKFIVINNYNDYYLNINDIEKIIIPGIGNYNFCMKFIKSNKLDEVIYDHLGKNKKIMGICLGMQILTTIGDEGGKIQGLDIIKNTNTEIMKTDHILPHIGWTKINIKNKDDPIYKNINNYSDFYFVHSYNVISKNKDIISATSNYGNYEFISIIKTNNILGIQFHPEKSGPSGIKLIENFLNLL